MLSIVLENRYGNRHSIKRKVSGPNARGIFACKSSAQNQRGKFARGSVVGLPWSRGDVKMIGCKAPVETNKYRRMNARDSQRRRPTNSYGKDGRFAFVRGCHYMLYQTTSSVFCFRFRLLRAPLFLFVKMFSLSGLVGIEPENELG